MQEQLGAVMEQDGDNPGACAEVQVDSQLAPNHRGLSKIEARLRRVNDAELLMLARVLKCGVADLYPGRPGDLARVLRQARG